MADRASAPTRRQALAAGAGLVVALRVPALALAADDDDRALLESLLGLELRAVATYDSAVAGGVLNRRVESLARDFAEHERRHAATLVRQLKVRGVDRHREPASSPPARSARDALEAAIAIETATIAAYHHAVGAFKDAQLLQSAASVMADEGQHLAILRDAVGRDPIPSAFEAGRR